MFIIYRHDGIDNRVIVELLSLHANVDDAYAELAKLRWEKERRDISERGSIYEFDLAANHVV